MQIKCNHPADQCLCFCSVGSTIPFLSKSDILSLMTVVSQKTGFLLMKLYYSKGSNYVNFLVQYCS